jgi:hypothetical protein
MRAFSIEDLEKIKIFCKGDQGLLKRSSGHSVVKSGTKMEPNLEFVKVSLLL